MRVAYFNPKYPWIEAVWMYKNPRNHWPKQFDIARMAFPTHVQGVGKHIVHWMWRGYRDCIDVDVLPDSVPVPNTSSAMYGYKVRARVRARARVRVRVKARVRVRALTLALTLPRT